MSLYLLSPPVGEPASLDEMKAHLRVDGANDDGLIAAALAGATRAIEARAGLALLTQSWRLLLDAVPAETVILPLAPVQSVDAVAVSGDPVDLSAYDFIAGAPGKLRARGPWPAPAESLGGVAIDFTAGYGAASDIPAPLVHAVKMLAAHFYENREAAGEARVHSVPRSVDALIAPYRELRL